MVYVVIAEEMCVKYSIKKGTIKRETEDGGYVIYFEFDNEVRLEYAPKKKVFTTLSEAVELADSMLGE